YSPAGGVVRLRSAAHPTTALAACVARTACGLATGQAVAGTGTLVARPLGAVTVDPSAEVVARRDSSRPRATRHQVARRHVDFVLLVVRLPLNVRDGCHWQLAASANEEFPPLAASCQCHPNRRAPRTMIRH